MKNNTKQQNNSNGVNSTGISIIVAGLLIAGAIYITSNKNQTQSTSQDDNKSEKERQNENIQNVSIVEGKQIIEIKAKGEYTPRRSIAKAGIPTIIRFNTSGTFDCSSFVRIPSMNISKILPNSGITDIDIGNQPVGTLQGSCGMGMYPFEIQFN